MESGGPPVSLCNRALPAVRSPLARSPPPRNGMLARALSLPVRDDDGAAGARWQSPKNSIVPRVPPEMELIGVHGRTVRVAFHRRRHHGRRVIPGLSAATAISSIAVLLIVLLALLSLLAPPLLEQHTFPEHSSSIPIQGRNRIERSLLEEETFQVPKAGWSSVHDLWRSNLSEYYRGCSNASSKFIEASAHPNRYLMIATSGGLNQQRTGIIDAVVAARILNATLVVPRLDQKSFWKDASDFSEIFDVDWFISSLSKDIRIIKQLPIRGEKEFLSPYSMRVPRKCTPNCYQKRVLPVLVKRHVVQLTKFDYRLSNKLETDLQKLRCRVNYHALKFTDSIHKMGDTLIQRMKMKSKRFIALHLRFEPDMLAFSGCYYGGGDKEKRELGSVRKRWKTLHNNNPEKERRHGKCPLSPEEVGLMLRALGFGSDVHLYVASGEIYGGEETLAPLRALFTNFHSKETLASKEELAPFKAFSSRMAALDFIVCDGSDVFVTNNNGNMARILAGRRRYFGHKRTIRLNAKKLHVLFMSRDNMTWETFASKVHKSQKGFMGEPNEVKPGQGEFHENPLACICENTGAKMTHPIFERQNIGSSQRLSHNDKQQANGYLTNEELESHGKNNGKNSMGKRPSDEAELDYDLFTNHDDLYFEERFPD